MDQRERTDDDEEMLRMVVEARLTRLWTSMPCRVTKFDAVRQTVEAQPAINGRQKNPDGTFRSIQLPVLVDIPVVWPGGGGVTLTFPIKVGDECLVEFSARAIDSWFTSGFVNPAAGTSSNDANNPPEYRLHNLSDGFAFVGVRNQTRKLSGVSTTTARLRTDDNTCFIDLDPSGKIVAITAPGGVNINGVTIDSSGNVSTAGTVTATTDVVGGGKHLKTHVHSGITSGASNSGPPV